MQVLDTSKNCIKELKKNLIGALDELVKDGYDKLRQSLEPNQKTASVHNGEQIHAYTNTHMHPSTRPGTRTINQQVSYLLTGVERSVC